MGSKRLGATFVVMSHRTTPSSSPQRRLESVQEPFSRLVTRTRTGSRYELNMDPFPEEVEEVERKSDGDAEMRRRNCYAVSGASVVLSEFDSLYLRGSMGLS